jgi:TusA-related sulfurtransferase
MLILDHLTVAALTIDAGVAHVERALGVVIPAGGAHPLMATHNHLMQLGDGVFLEVIAPDPGAVPQRTRWFALDDPKMRERLKNSPRLVTWVARVPDLHLALGAIRGATGEAVCVSRGALSWQIGLIPDGSLPFDGAFPTLIEWPKGPLPSAGMPDLGCRLERLEVEHPEGNNLTKLLASSLTDDRVTISSAAKFQIRAVIQTANGLRELT